MENKVIFLDIDGVIATDAQYFMNTTKFRKKNEWAEELRVPYPFDKGCVKILNEILEYTNAEIVLSSSWKKMYRLEDLDVIFKKNGIVKSPIATTSNIYASASNITKNRVAEIEEYLTNNKVGKYVVIDDLPLDEYMTSTNNDDKFVKTIDSEGLKQLNIKEKILKILND